MKIQESVACHCAIKLLRGQLNKKEFLVVKITKKMQSCSKHALVMWNHGYRMNSDTVNFLLVSRLLRGGQKNSRRIAKKRRMKTRKLSAWKMQGTSTTLSLMFVPFQSANVQQNALLIKLNSFATELKNGLTSLRLHQKLVQTVSTMFDKKLMISVILHAKIRSNQPMTPGLRRALDLHSCARDQQADGRMQLFQYAN